MKLDVLYGVGTSAAKQALAAAEAPGRWEAVELEATLLAVLFDQALAQNKAAFGPGLGGDFARSQLCQELARGLAAGGGIGIARTVEDALAQAASSRRDAFGAGGR